MEQKLTTYGAGQLLFKQGEKGGELFFIKTGKVELTVRNAETGAEAVVATLGEKSVIGTMSFLEGEPRSATAKCLTEVQCVQINQAQREKLLETIPNWFRVLVKDLTSGVRRTNDEYTRLKANYEILEKKYNALKKKNEPEAPAKKAE